MAHRYKFKNKQLVGSVKDEVKAIACKLYKDISQNPIVFLDRTYLVKFYNNKNAVIPFYEIENGKFQKNNRIKDFRTIKIGKFQLEDLATEYYNIPYSKTYGKYDKPYNKEEYSEMKEIYEILLKLITTTNDDIRKYFSDD